MIRMIVSHVVSSGLMAHGINEVVNITSIEYCPNKPANYEAKSDFVANGKMIYGYGETLEAAIQDVHDCVKSHLASQLVNDIQHSEVEKFKRAFASGIRREGELRSAIANAKESHKSAVCAQIAQSIRSGYLRGEELNSILAFNPEIAPLVEEILKIVNTTV